MHYARMLLLFLVVVLMLASCAAVERDLRNAYREQNEISHALAERAAAADLSSQFSLASLLYHLEQGLEQACRKVQQLGNSRLHRGEEASRERQISALFELPACEKEIERVREALQEPLPGTVALGD